MDLTAMGQKFMTLILLHRFKKLGLIPSEYTLTTTEETIRAMEERMLIQPEGTSFKRLLSLNNRLYHPLTASDEDFLDKLYESAHVGMLMDDRARDMECEGYFLASDQCTR